MRIIKFGIISVVFFAIFLTLLSFLFPSHIRISKATDIRTEKDSLLAQLSVPANWKNWYPGADTSEVFFVDGQAKGIVTSEGKGIVITTITDSSVLVSNRGPELKKGNAGWNIFPGSAPNVYTVQWFMDIHLRWYPWEKFSGLLMEKRYGPMMENGLDKLKKLLEK